MTQTGSAEARNDPVAVVRRWFEEVWNLRRVETIDELVATTAVCHTDEGDLRGPAEFRARQYEPFVSGFPDLRVSLADLISRGDQVVVRWEARGTHTGPGIGVEPTGRPVVMRGISWIRVVDGRLQEGWQSSNIMDVVRSLHAPAMPPPGPTNRPPA